VDSVAFGRGFKALRVKKRLRQEDLASESGVSRSVVARIEQGHADRVTIDVLERVARPLGARVVCRLTWNGEGLDRLLDAAHAAIVDQVVGLLRGAGWVVAAEVSFNHFGERGSIDVLAFHAETRILLVVEVKSVVPDVQSTLVTLDRKQRLAAGIGRERGWNAASVATLLVIRDDRTARRRIAAHAETFGNAFPDRVAKIRSWIGAPDPKRTLHGLWFLSGDRSAVASRQVRGRRDAAERGSQPNS
jgi:transcriptional regulator with XRE-family HTH domain